MTGDTVGGVWTYTLDLAASLAPYGIEVLLASMGGEPSKEQRADAAKVGNLQLRTSGYKLEWMNDPWRDVEASGRWLLDLEDQFRPDVVHLNTFGHGALPWLAPVVLTAHSCVLSWWAAVKHEPVPPQWDRYRQLVEQSVHAAALLVAPSRAMLRAMEKHYGPGLPESRVVPNGRKHTGLRPAVKEPFVLTAGRLWDEAKNVAGVAAIADRLPWPSYVAGEDKDPNGRWIELSGCHSLGRLSAEELAGWFARASIYALPARYEPFGLSALEAALAGCALVLGDIPSLREVWRDAAVFVPPDDANGLQAAVCGLIERPAKRYHMAHRAMVRARTFTPERMARGYVEAYASLMGAGRTACAS
jgi:glycogen synthase